ncbi:phosphoglycolate phosphatase [Marinobacterium nitratireducens]|uniref:Phosphoglycolate phosphatase n=1 Tax=Marinobacterium nitratireducens TaxID=518897 RepID=A0A918DU88_9GAMM|nr:HAD-IA family hydrolase [Marinobacterium nitratireducens]GGO82678.1 phosphoglycolate phosphatase [Marinobacterium nitratireducens]
MKQPLDAVLFDLDGTLLDTAPDFIWVINRLLGEEGRPVMAFDSLREQVSNGANAMIRTAFGIDETHEEFAGLRTRFLDIYGDHLAIESRAFDGIDELLFWLDEIGIPWGVVTNKPERYTRGLLAALQLDRRAGSIVCPEQVCERKPHPESLWLACRELGCRPEHSLYIGDHVRDIEAGRNAGMPTIAARYGYVAPGENPDDWQADHGVDSARAIKPLLQSLYHL